MSGGWPDGHATSAVAGAGHCSVVRWYGWLWGCGDAMGLWRCHRVAVALVVIRVRQTLVTVRLVRRRDR